MTDILQNISLAALRFAMGMMNPALTRIGGETVSLTFITGTSRTRRHFALALEKTPASGL
jgi:uncharacterized membrane protein YoaK (UPF0700 family)